MKSNVKTHEIVIKPAIRQKIIVSVTYFQWKSVIEEKFVKRENTSFKITTKVAISSAVKELKFGFY